MRKGGQVAPLRLTLYPLRITSSTAHAPLAVPSAPGPAVRAPWLRSACAEGGARARFRSDIAAGAIPGASAAAGRRDPGGRDSVQAPQRRLRTEVVPRDERFR